MPTQRNYLINTTTISTTASGTTIVSGALYNNRGIPHPGRIWYRGRWRTPEQVERSRSNSRQAKRRYRANDPERERKNWKIWQERNRDKLRAIQRTWRAKHSDKLKKNRRAWYVKNRARVHEYDQRRYWADPVTARKRASDWNKKNPDKVAERNRRYRDRKRGALRTERIAPSIIAAIRRQRCTYCGGSGGTVDHFIPLSRGGTDTLENLRPACITCNVSKNDSDPHEWLKRRGIG